MPGRTERLHLDGATVDWRTHRLRGAETDTILPDYLVRLLAYFVSREGEVVTREQLAVDVWDFAPTVQTNAVNMGVSRLRRLIERDPRRPRHIITVRGEGWMFVGIDADRTARIRTNTPPPVIDTVGRDELVDELTACLASELPHLHVVGLPGVGKSHAMAEAARRHLLARPSAEVWWVGAGEGPLRDRVAEVLDVAPDMLGSVLRNRPGLVIVVDPVEEWRSEDIAALVRDSGALIVTLGLTDRPASRSVLVQPLSRSASWELLTIHLRRRDGNASIASAHREALLDQLAGLPANIQLAASRLAVIGPEQLLADPVAAPRHALDAVVATLEAPVQQRYLRWRWLCEPFRLSDAEDLARCSTREAEDGLTALMRLGLVRRSEEDRSFRMVLPHHSKDGTRGRDAYVEWAVQRTCALHDATADGRWASMLALYDRRVELWRAASLADDAARARIAWRLDGLLGFRGRHRESYERTARRDASLLSEQEQHRLKAVLALRAALTLDTDLTQSMLDTLERPWPVPALRAALRVAIWQRGAEVPVDPQPILDHPDATAMDLAMVMLSMAGHARRRGAIDEAESWALRALAVVDRHDVERMRPGVWAMLGNLHQRRGDLGSAVHCLHKALDACVDDDIVPTPVVLFTLGYLEACIRDEAASEHLQRAARAFRRAGDLRQSAQAFGDLAAVCVENGDVVGAQSAMASAMAMVLDAGDSHMGVSVAATLCLTSAARGQLGMAALHIESVPEGSAMTPLQRRHLLDLRALIGLDPHLEAASERFHPEIDLIHRLALARTGSAGETLAEAIDAVSTDPTTQAALGVRLALRVMRRALERSETGQEG